jgi:transposase
MMHNTTLVAGIDTAKDKLDVVIHGQQRCLSVVNAKPGWRQIAGEFRQAGVGRVGIEATGGYERGVTQHLRQAGVTVLVLQPMQTKNFARLNLRRARNDRIDAALIAACTTLLEAPGLEHDPRMLDLGDHLTFIEQVEEDISRAKTRIEHIHIPRLRRLAEREIKRQQALRDKELRRIEATLRAEQDLATRLDLLLSVPGIAERTAIALVVRMPELGRISREQAAALAGLAPFDDDSGKHRGLRHIAGGRERLRRSLYRAALPAAFHWNPALQAFYARLRARGKSHTAALVACARKLLVFANTVIQRGTPWVSQTTAVPAEPGFVT